MIKFILPVALVLGIATNLNGQSGEKDPFNSSVDANANSIADRMGQFAQPDFTFKGEIHSFKQQLAFSVDKVRSGQELRLKLLVTNRLDAPLEFTEIKSSCGCFSGFPTELKLNKNVTLPIDLVYRVPRKEEEFEKVLNLYEKGGGALLQVNITGKSKHVIHLEQSVFPIRATGRQTIETVVRSEFVEFPLDTLKVRFNSDEAAGVRLIPDSPSGEPSVSGKLVVDLIVEDSESPGGVETLEVVHQSKVVGYIPMEFQRLYRPMSRPSVIIARATDEWYVGRALIQLEGLSRPSERTESMLTVNAVSSTPALSYTFEAKANLSGQTNSLTVVEIMIDKRKIRGSHKDLKLSVNFAAKGSVLNVPVSIFE